VKLLSLFTLILFLSACQPAEKETKTATDTSDSTAKKEETTPSPAAEVSPLIEQPYDIVESDITCEEPVVIEFFAYQCPHCYKLESFAEAWKKKNQGKVKFQAVPTHLGHQEFGSFLIVHQTAKNLGILDKAMPALFKRLHEDKKTFASQDEAIAFLVALGASEDAVKTAISNEEKIKTGIDENFLLMQKYKISGVPTILVNHQYQFNVTKAGGYDKVFEVVEETLKLPSNCPSK